MNASVSVSREGPNDAFSRQQILSFLSSFGVKVGLNEDALEKLIAEQIFDVMTPIARGTEPEKGADGWVEYFFDAEPKLTPREHEDGSVDYADVNLVQNVEPGQVLARLHPATSGKHGNDLAGNTIAAVAGKPGNLSRGKNTSYADAQGYELRADTPGHVRLTKDRTVEVTTLFEVNGDVNYTVGNIDFVGDVIVRGDVLSGFRIRAQGSVEVNGVVEDAEIEAENNVVIHGGFIGSGRGRIRAGVNVTAKYVHHQQINAGVDIGISNEAMDATLIAGRSVSVVMGAGVLAGGKASAGEFIEVKVLGNEKHTRTDVIIPIETNLKAELNEQKKQYRENELRLHKLQIAIAGMIEVDKYGTVSEERRQLYATLYKAEKELTEHIENETQAIKELEKRFKARTAKLFVRALRNVHPQVTVTIGEKMYPVFEKMQRSQFRLDGEEIVAT